jgi:hypothetical protein
MVFASFVALSAFALTCYGWGRIAFELIYRGRPPLHAYAAGLGLIVLLFIGGILNAARQATTLSLSICAYAGIAFAIYFIARGLGRVGWRSSIAGKRSIPGLLLLAFVGGLAAFLVTQLLPTQIFNLHDDFFSYFVRPIRMLATGSVGGNPYELLGMSDYGAQSFLQAFFLVWLPLTDLPAFDTIFCFLLGILLLAEIGHMNAAPSPLIALAIAVYVVINPQIVNLSSVYSSAVVVLTLLIAGSILLSESENRPSSARLLGYAIPFGGSLAALIALKLSSAFFVGCFFVVFFALLLLVRATAALAAAVATGIAACVTLVPWVLPHLDKLNPTRWSSTPSEWLDLSLTRYPGLLELLRDGSGLYGASRSQFAFVVVALVLSLVAGVLALFQRPRRKDHVLRVAADAAGLSVYIALACVVNNEDALRYSCPFLIALVSSRALFPLSLPSPNVGSYPTAQAPRDFMVALATTQVALVLIFAGPLLVRITRIITDHTTLPFLFSQEMRDFETKALGDNANAQIRSVQAKTPPGSTIWAWIDTPFQLDFARNRVWHFHHTWSVAPWRLNASTGEALRQELSSRGVDYVLWQYRSDSTPRVPTLRTLLQQPQWVEYTVFYQNTLALILALPGMASPFDIVHNDGNVVLIQIRR